MNIKTKTKALKMLNDIRDDVDAIYHHQTDRVVREIEEVIASLRKFDPAKADPLGRRSIPDDFQTRKGL